MELTQKIVRELLDYDPDTGELSWRPRGSAMFSSPGSCKSWNTKYAGKRAGCIVDSGHGYKCRKIQIGGRLRKEHRVIWLYMTGHEPPEFIDHINRDATDNRWINLRQADSKINGTNQSMPKGNSSGVTGVYWNKAAKKWHAQVWHEGMQNYLGLYSEIDEAAMAVMEFRHAKGFDPGHGLEIAKYHHTG